MSQTSTARRGALKLLALAVALLLLATLANVLDGGNGVEPRGLFEGVLAPWANALPALLLMLALLALCRRLLLSLWLSLAALVLLYGVNRLKMEVLQAPLLPQDFRLLDHLGGDTGLLAHYLPTGASLWLTVAAILLIAVTLAWSEPPLLRWRWRARLPLTLVAVAALASLVGGVAPWRSVYAAAALNYQPWTTAGSLARDDGLVSMLLLRTLYAPRDAIGDGDPALARALLQAHAAGIEARLGPPTRTPLPDIVVLQSESFFDPARLRGYAPAQFLPNLRRLEKHGLSGNMTVPTYGGGTIRTEFEVLTGVPLALKPALRYPYMGLTAARIPGLASALKQAGYRCTAIHPHQGGFWNRESVFRRMGFDRFITIASPLFDHAPKRGYYVDDQALTDVILGQLQQDGPPQFLFAISIENHGPYLDFPMSDARRAQAATIPVPPGIRGDPKRELQHYLLRERDADRQLGRLADALARRTRPTLLVFYGDHLPGLAPAFAHGFDDGGVPSRQPVPYLLIEPGAGAPPVRRDLPSWMLAATLLDAAGVHDDRYFALLRALEPELAANHWQPGTRLLRQLDSLTALRLGDRAASIAKPVLAKR
ncbi:MAG TPA: sulfatase-like hydrolase/transferase [Rhodanobacteraceae bacterium]|nr:sulfatase-like hydrolase/transferase [Rhodanobacteraceae bacterium]